jgi:signal transduction histidine kinase/ActR/RegA family two-component response regulator
MRTIAEFQDRIARAFSPSAAAGEAEPSAETMVRPTKVAEAEHDTDPLGNLISQLRGWSFRQRRRSLQGRLKASEAANAAKSRRIATVVHEIRTPLNGILGMTHLLSQTKLTAEQQNYLSGIRQSGHMLAQLVDDILDLSTMEAGRFRLNNRAENLRQLLESVVEMLAHRAHEKRIEIAATFAADMPDLLDFDPARLRQVLFNVIGNAVKFTLEGGVLVRVAVVDGDVQIAVADTGPGMTPEEQASVFGEFEQAGSAEARSGGTGLGLGIAARILAEFGGSLSVRSHKGEGSVFTIRFPMRLAEDAPAGDADRGGMLSRSRVLLLAPHGPTAEATITTIEALGGRCRHVSRSQDVPVLIDRAAVGAMPFTDLVVDHRLASDYACEPSHRPLHRILLVNPEERASQPQDLFDAWLIRPLRERSLVDVLSGRMRGFGRMASSDDTDPQVPTAPHNAEAVALDILLAEDDPVSATLLRAMLQRSGHSVRWVGDVPSLADALRQTDKRPDLVITDMHMPGGNPMDVFVDLRTEETISNVAPVPVIVLTGDCREDLASDVLAAGAQRVLRKPVEPEQLFESIRALSPEMSAQKQAR